MSNITLLYECADCKQPLSFRHTETNMKVCSCGTVNRKDENQQLIAISFPLTTTADSIIRIGTNGVFEGKTFEVIGRFRAWFPENVFNYWTIIFSDGTLGFLGEGYGIYAIYEKRELKNPFNFLSFKTWSPDDTVTWSEEKFRVQRMNEITKTELQGECLLLSTTENIHIGEISSPSGTHLELMAVAYKDPLCFEVFFMSPAALQLSAVGTVSHPGLDLKCKQCGFDLHIKTFPYAQSCACPQCRALYFYHNGKFEYKQVLKETGYSPNIPVGSVGTIQNVSFEVIGYCLKQDYSTYQSQWKEYTLWNETEGFVFLSEYEGHWTFLKEAPNAPVLTSVDVRNFTFGNGEFDLYNRYQFQIIAAEGEFVGNVLNDGGTDVHEFIDPPKILIREKNKGEGIVWFKGEHIEKKQIAEAFNVNLPRQIGRGLLETRGFVPLPMLIKVTGVVLLIFALVHILLSNLHSNKEILFTDVAFNDSSATVTKVSNKFTLEKKTNLQINITAPVNNNWVAVGTTLVNADKGTEYSLEQGVEFYSGVEDGESWSEGSRSETGYFSSIPAGNYYLQLEGAKDTFTSLGAFTIEVRKDVSMERNLLIMFALLLIWPVAKYFLISHAEKDRWYNSPFTPYEYDDE